MFILKIHVYVLRAAARTTVSHLLLRVKRAVISFIFEAVPKLLCYQTVLNYVKLKI